MGNLITLQKNKVAHLGKREIDQMVPSKAGICENSQEDNNLRVG